MSLLLSQRTHVGGNPPLGRVLTSQGFMLSCPCVGFRWFYIVVVPDSLVSLRRWENPEDIDIHEVGQEEELYLYPELELHSTF